MIKKIWYIFSIARPSLRFYVAIAVLIFFYILAYIWDFLLSPAHVLFWMLLLLICVDGFLLLKHKSPISASRLPKYKRLSNGDENEMKLLVQSFYPFSVLIRIIDELPVQFQERKFTIRTTLLGAEEKYFVYNLRPVERGEYHFGKINVFVLSALGLVERHIKFESPFQMDCYPSFIRLRQFELLAISNKLSDIGIKRIRRVGSSTEFEQIKEYVAGDDIRNINWKATARKSQLMVNHYIDEKSQHVYSVIDMGRVMKMPFDGLKLLDYAINAALVINHVAWIKQDKPGVIGFNNQIKFKVKADNKGNQLLKTQEALYNANSGFLESSFDNLYAHVRRTLTQRSLLLLFTNFESLNALQRQLKYLRKLSQQHLLVVIFFENTELHELLNMKPSNTYDIYRQTIAQKFDYEKRLIAIELQKYGILSVYSTPEKLSINALNKYLEIKARNLI